ncbi:MAG: FxsA family protein [Deltaproteobacteria bacterium]|nr:FxsA family protein [Deltaproteobacteria bacterium]
MFLRLFLLFTIVPIIEVWLLIKVGRVIGALPTVAILLAISMAGAWLARSQGFRTIVAIRDELAAGRLPAAHFLDGALILAGGILLLTPGFFTDLIGLFFLIPATRRLLKRWLRIWLEQRLLGGKFVIRRR